LPKFDVAIASEITPLKNWQPASGTRRAHSLIGFCRFPNQFDQPAAWFAQSPDRRRSKCCGQARVRAG
jgi:hypothetical protein